MPVSFKVTDEERDLIIKIAWRADAEIFKPHKIEQTVLDTTMDLSACIAQGMPLKLRDLLMADEGNFAHDICGIRRHIDRTTGKLGGCFLPRFADVEKMKGA
jgi:hypothetical protein